MSRIDPIRKRGMWTTENRSRYDRSKLRYPSGLTDDEWSVIEPLITPAKRGGKTGNHNRFLRLNCLWMDTKGDASRSERRRAAFAGFLRLGSVSSLSAMKAENRHEAGRGFNDCSSIRGSEISRRTAGNARR